MAKKNPNLNMFGQVKLSVLQKQVKEGRLSKSDFNTEFNNRMKANDAALKAHKDAVKEHEKSHGGSKGNGEQRPMLGSSDWDESKHPRDSQGRFD